MSEQASERNAWWMSARRSCLMRRAQLEAFEHRRRAQLEALFENLRPTSQLCESGFVDETVAAVWNELELIVIPVSYAHANRSIEMQACMTSQAWKKGLELPFVRVLGAPHLTAGPTIPWSRLHPRRVVGLPPLCGAVCAFIILCSSDDSARYRRMAGRGDVRLDTVRPCHRRGHRYPDPFAPRHHRRYQLIRVALTPFLPMNCDGAPLLTPPCRLMREVEVISTQALIARVTPT